MRVLRQTKVVAKERITLAPNASTSNALLQQSQCRHRLSKEIDEKSLRVTNGILTEPGRHTIPRNKVHVIWIIRRRRRLSMRRSYAI